MPLPLIPFAIKGALVVGKMIMAKGAAAKVTYAAAHTVKAVGAAKAMAGTVAALAVVGGISWTAENISRARKAHKAAKAGELSEAAQHLIGIATSIQGAFSNDLAGEFLDWKAAGYPANRRVITLARHAYDAARSAKSAT